MAVAQGLLLATMLLFTPSSALPACPEPCTCQEAPLLLNCSSSALPSVPKPIQDSVSGLDLSHNLLSSVTLDRPRYYLRSLWLGNNSLVHLSLCTDGRNVRGRRLQRPRGRGGCLSWAPALQLLSAERNQLEQLPEGLEGCEALQVLQLSFNRISSLRPGELSPLRRLKELHLHHNLITSLHPQMFQDLAHLQVLDLSFNMLTSLNPVMYLTLRNIGADVRLGGNRWRCDCSMRGLRRWMAYDSSRGRQTWSVECASPSVLSGRDLLQSEEENLNCLNMETRGGVHQDLTIHSGSDILLSCSSQDSFWWTPTGESFVSQPEAGLLIRDIREKDMGLYVCVSEKDEVLSVFNLQISPLRGARRKSRSLPRNSQEIIQQGDSSRMVQGRNVVHTQSDLALAVCLSILFTFLVAFILGVIARPCVDRLWKRVTSKKSASATNTATSAEQRQYDNEGFANGEDPEDVVTYRERRVTFTKDDSRNGTVQYYDTVAGDAVIECEAAGRQRSSLGAGDSGSENSSTVAGRTQKMKYEHIPDAVDVVQRRGSSSSSSSSSLSDRDVNNQQKIHIDHSTPKSSQLVEATVQQRAAVNVPQISIEGKSEIPGFSSEPFANWSPHARHANLAERDDWEENGENFDFSDSVRSTSPRSSSVFGSFKDSKLVALGNKKKGDTSSSSSHVSGDEPTLYIVNPDQEQEDGERNHNESKVTNVAVRPQHSSSSPSSDSDSDGAGNKVKRDLSQREEKTKQSSGIAPVETVKPIPSARRLPPASQGKSLKARAPAPPVPPAAPAAHSSSISSDSEPDTTVPKPKVAEGIIGSVGVTASIPASSSSSSDESADETVNRVQKNKQGLTHVTKSQDPYSQTARPVPEKPWPGQDLEHTTPTKRSPGNKAPPKFSDSSLSSDDETHHRGRPTFLFQTSQTSKQRPVLDTEQSTQDKTPLDIKAAPKASSSSSSSSGSEDETNYIKRQEQVLNRPSIKAPPTVGLDLKTQWPVIDLGHSTRVKRRLDIKVRSPPSDSSSSSSSESEDETTRQKETPKKVFTEKLQTSTSRPVPQTRWPVLDLERSTRVKRRLDVKVSSKPSSSSSSSSESEDETNYIKKQEQGQMQLTRPSIKTPPTVGLDLKTQWPVIDLGHSTRVKRRLDIKVSSKPSSSSSHSSSDGEDETSYIKKQEQGQTHVGRPSSSSSSSSDSEDGTAPQKEKPMKVTIEKPQTSAPAPGERWPVLNLEHSTRVKRRLDIKVSSKASSGSSSSSDSEDDTAHYEKKHEQGQTHIARPSMKGPQTVGLDFKTQWPVIDLEHSTRLKRRLDFKASSPHSDSSSSSSSSSSDSEDETNYIKKQEQGQMQLTRPSIKTHPSVGLDLKTQWPVIDLGHSTRVKRRLDIKVQSPPSDSSPSSDSEDESRNYIKKQEQGQMHVARLSSSSSSSSDSEDETNYIKKQEQGQMQSTRPSIKTPPTVGLDLKTQWPVIDLGHSMGVKRRLDFKASSPHSDSSSSSSSESEDETPKKVFTEKLQTSTSRPVPQTRWPVLDLEHSTRVKRRLDIKAPSPASDSSSSSDSEDNSRNYIKKQEQGQMHVARLSSSSSSSSDGEDETNYIKKQEQGQMQITRPSIKTPPTVGLDLKTQWPVIDLGHSTRVKRRLDIKVRSPHSDSSSSSSSESEDETPKKVFTEKLQTSTSRPVPQTRWPVLDLEHSTRVRRRLDAKVSSKASSSSSSSSESEDETNHMKKQEQGQMQMTRPSIRAPPTVGLDLKTQWPVVDLGHRRRIKRRLEFKVSRQGSDSSSSSESEDESTNHVKKQEQGQVHFAKPSSSSSSSSDSEGETTPQKETPTKVTVEKPQTSAQTKWPVLNLERSTRVKRRLDIKVSSKHSSSSSSSSDSEDEAVKKQTQGLVQTGRPSIKGPHSASRDPHTRWPLLDLEHTTLVKRRLDIKTSSRASSSSSSSGESEDESTNYVQKQERGQVGMRKPSIKSQDSGSSSSGSDGEHEASGSAKLPIETSQSVTRDPETHDWPVVDPGNLTRIKRRLDIKAPTSPTSDTLSSGRNANLTVEGRKHTPRSSSSSSSDESDNGNTATPVKVETARTDAGITGVEQSIKVGFPRIGRRLDIKAPSQQPDPVLRGVSQRSGPSGSSSSSSDSDNENLSKPGSATETKFMKTPKIPGVTISPNPKTDHDIKLERYTVTPDDLVDRTRSQNTSATPEVNPELASRWASMNLNVSRFRKRLDITSTSRDQTHVPSSPPPPDSPSYSSGEGGSRGSRRRRRQRLLFGGQEIKPVNVSVSKGGDGSSENTVDGQERRSKDFTVPTTEIKSNQETLLIDFGTPALAKPPSKKQSRSSSSSENEDASTAQFGEGGKGTGKGITPTPAYVTQTERRAEGEFVMSNLSLTTIPRVKRALDIKTPVHRETSSSDNDTTDHGKAPLPEKRSSSSSSSSSESENENVSNLSGVTDNDTIITYKRTIMKSSSLTGNSSPYSGGQAEDKFRKRHTVAEMLTAAQAQPSRGADNASLAPKRVSSLSFDDVVKKRIQQPRRETDVDLPPEIRWTGVGRQLSDLSLPSRRTLLDEGSSLPRQPPPAVPPLRPPYSSRTSSSVSDDNTKQDVAPVTTYSSLSATPVSFATSRDLDEFDNPHRGTDELLSNVSEEKRERKGLSALKAMSVERHQWDTPAQNVDSGDFLLHSDPGSFTMSQAEANQRPEKEIKPLTSITKFPLSSTFVDGKRDTDLLYDFLSYRKHDFGDVHPPEEAPPPIPATAPPHEPVGLPWRSPKTVRKQALEGTRFYGQQSRNIEEFDPLASTFDASDISISKV